VLCVVQKSSLSSTEIDGYIDLTKLVMTSGAFRFIR
jgi:hypothetical protein